MSLVWERPCQIFSLDEMQNATENFSEIFVIGRGGFGKVYKGVIHDGSTKIVVAVKRLNSESKQGIKEFEMEIKMLSKCRHSNLVNLVGYCKENEEMILVYEYMSRGTLAHHLSSPLTWEQRLKICIGVARGLDYLHTGTGHLDMVIHLDVKCANILLDENLAAKMSDLGLSKIVPINKPEVIVDNIQGTPGYIDPHYRTFHKFSSKTDVYAFGVVLLEVLCGTCVMGSGIIPNPNVTNLADWIQRHIRKGSLNKIIDKSVLHQIHPECRKLLTSTASKCLHNDPTKRPSMCIVVAQLEVSLAFQTGTNPSSSITEDDIFQQFNAVSIDNDTHLETITENTSVDKEDPSQNPGVSVESQQKPSMESEGSSMWSTVRDSVAEYYDDSFDFHHTYDFLKECYSNFNNG